MYMMNLQAEGLGTVGTCCEKFGILASGLTTCLIDRKLILSKSFGRVMRLFLASRRFVSRALKIFNLNIFMLVRCFVFGIVSTLLLLLFSSMSITSTTAPVVVCSPSRWKMIMRNFPFGVTSSSGDNLLVQRVLKELHRVVCQVSFVLRQASRSTSFERTSQSCVSSVFCPSTTFSFNEF